MKPARHMGSGLCPVDRKPGVALVTSGPGLTNAVTPLADAWMDSIPIVLLSGQVPTTVLGTDAFQDCDSIGIIRRCTKHNYLIKPPRSAAPGFLYGRRGDQRRNHGQRALAQARGTDRRTCDLDFDESWRFCGPGAAMARRAGNAWNPGSQHGHARCRSP